MFVVYEVIVLTLARIDGVFIVILVTSFCSRTDGKTPISSSTPPSAEKNSTPSGAGSSDQERRHHHHHVHHHARHNGVQNCPNSGNANTVHPPNVSVAPEEPAFCSNRVIQITVIVLVVVMAIW